MVPGLEMDFCFLETNLFDLPHECAAHFVLWTVTIFYHLFSFPCRALGERNIFDPAILWREGGWRYNVGVVSGTRINCSAWEFVTIFNGFPQFWTIRVKWVQDLILAQRNKCSLGWWN